jgi:4-diphosphocytidyl-2-C-methyl-D-erythritol kinase
MALRALYELPAPAKLNLFLHVVGRRADGMHLLESVFVLIDWADVVHVERRDDGRLARHDLAAALPPDDLCLRAARVLQEASGTAFGADLHLDKRVPWGAGLGGGSSDAATVLLALNRLWGLDWPRSRLASLAATLGADVPFFVGGRDAFVSGIGERLTPLVLPRAWYAVVKPPESLATGEIFAHPLVRRDTPSAILSGFLADGIAPGPEGQLAIDPVVSGWGRNDLQAAAADRCPAIADVARWLDARYGNSRMTGSGSAVFARAGSGLQPTATFPAQALAPGWVGRLCRGLGQHPLVDWARD